MKQAGQANYVEYLNACLLQPERFQKWLYDYDITDFGGFQFLESPSFESCNGSYFSIVFEPVTKEEKKDFHNKKLESCVKILAIIGVYADLSPYISGFLKLNLMENFFGNKDIIEHLVYEQIAENQGTFAQKIELGEQ